MIFSLVVFLHGVGSRGADLEPLAHYLAPALPEAEFEAPDAPMPSDLGGPGRQWFSVSGVTEANRTERVVAARPAFDAVISDLLERHNLSDRPEQVAMVGFSQGTIMALDSIASGRWNFGAVVGFSGRLATQDPLAPPAATRVLLLHGTGDPVLPAKESELAYKRLNAAGADVSLKLLPGLGHSISTEGLELAATHLSKSRSVLAEQRL